MACKALSMVRLAGVPLAMLLFAAQLVGAIVVPASDPSFSLSTSSASFPAGGNAYVAAVLQDVATGLDATVAYRAGGVAFTGSDDTTAATANNQQWLANDYTGATWTSLGTAAWSARAYGSTIYVPLAAGSVNGILLIAGGILASGASTNQVWSSVDMTYPNGTRTLGTNWKLNGPCSASGCAKIAFYPRALSGLIAAAGFNDTSTKYAYLMGGVSQLVGFPITVYNDVYYTVGKAVTDWVAFGTAPWSKRYGFGIESYTFSDTGVAGIIIAGGYNTIAQATNDAWAWDPSKSKDPNTGKYSGSLGWIQLKAQVGFLPSAGYLNMVRNSTNWFLIGGQIPSFTGAPLPLSQPYTTRPNDKSQIANWLGTSPGLPDPQRANQSVVAVRNKAAGVITGFVYFGGSAYNNNNGVFTPKNDVWYAKSE